MIYRLHLHDDNGKKHVFRVTFNSTLMQNMRVAGMVIGHKIYFAYPRKLLTEQLFLHELCHAKQIMRYGAILYTLKFFWYQLRYGYQRNPFEIEAREAEKQPPTDTEYLILCSLKSEFPPSPKASPPSSRPATPPPS